jgi:hypothetical protein
VEPPAPRRADLGRFAPGGLPFQAAARLAPRGYIPTLAAADVRGMSMTAVAGYKMTNNEGFAPTAPIPLRIDFDAVALRALARRLRNADQTGRLAAPAAISHGASCQPTFGNARMGQEA